MKLLNYGGIPGFDKIPGGLRLRVMQKPLIDDVTFDLNALEKPKFYYYIAENIWGEIDYFGDIPRLVDIETGDAAEVCKHMPSPLQGGFNTDDYLYFYSDDKVPESKDSYVYDPRNNIWYKIPSNIGRPRRINNDLIFFRHDSMIFAYEFNGNLRWSQKISEYHGQGRNISYPAPDLMFWESSIIYLRRLEEAAFELVALDVASGDILWERKLDGFVNRVGFCEGRLLVTPSNILHVISAADGSILEQFPIKEASPRGYLDPWFDGTYFYVIDHGTKKLFVFKSELTEPLAVLPCPQGFYFGTARSFTKSEGKNYLELVGGWAHALLVWKTEDVCQNMEIDIEPIISHRVDIVKFSKREAYSLRIETHDIHALLRFGELIIVCLGGDKGKTNYHDSDGRNRKFDGQIELVVDHSAFGVDDKPYLDLLLRSCKAALWDTNSGNGKDPIRLTWRFDNEPTKMVDLDLSRAAPVPSNPYAGINTIEEIEAVLNVMQARLDATEYDDESEFNEALEELYPEAVRQSAKKGAELGSMQGHHLYGRLLLSDAQDAKAKYKPWKSLIRQAKQQVASAAALGCPGAMEDLASECAVEFACSWAEQIAYTLLLGNDVDKMISYSRENGGSDIGDAEVEQGRKLYIKLKRAMEKSGFKKKTYCNCLFP